MRVWGSFTHEKGNNSIYILLVKLGLLIRIAILNKPCGSKARPFGSCIRSPVGPGQAPVHVAGQGVTPPGSSRSEVFQTIWKPFVSVNFVKCNWIFYLIFRWVGWVYVHPPPYPRLRPWKPMTIEERRDVFTLVLQSVHVNFIERERERDELYGDTSLHAFVIDQHFSAMRLLKTFLRSTMCIERLSSLALLHIYM